MSMKSNANDNSQKIEFFEQVDNIDLTIQFIK